MRAIKCPFWNFWRTWSLPECLTGSITVSVKKHNCRPRQWQWQAPKHLSTPWAAQRQHYWPNMGSLTQYRTTPQYMCSLCCNTTGTEAILFSMDCNQKGNNALLQHFSFPSTIYGTFTRFLHLAQSLISVYKSHTKHWSLAHRHDSWPNSLFRMMQLRQKRRVTWCRQRLVTPSIPEKLLQASHPDVQDSCGCNFVVWDTVRM